jgi:hypothetical protein
MAFTLYNELAPWGSLDYFAVKPLSLPVAAKLLGEQVLVLHLTCLPKYSTHRQLPAS